VPSRPTKPVSRPTLRLAEQVTLCLAEQMTRCLPGGLESDLGHATLDQLAGGQIYAGLAPQSRDFALLLEA
jgi:hypothetical protein